MMLENVSPRLGERGGPHHGSPDKAPAARLATLEAAGRLKVPFTTGILIGIGETRAERIDSLLAIAALHRRHGHIQEVIIQNFRAKNDTGMARAPEPDADEMLWTVAMARIVFGPSMNIQAPPNLSPGLIADLIAAGISDWGGVSPVTPDHVNPDAPWPAIEQLRAGTAAAGKCLTERLAIYPGYVHERRAGSIRPCIPRCCAPRTRTATHAARAGHRAARHKPSIRFFAAAPAIATSTIDKIIRRASAGRRLGEEDIVTLFNARGGEFDAVCASADELRNSVSGDIIGYVVNRNINYTNICNYGCRFCAFSKGKLGDTLRGPAYDLDSDEIERRVREAWDRGATEVCMQGGIHPRYTGATYLNILKAAKRAVSDIHVHAFSPLEVHHGATSLGLTVGDYLDRLRGAGLGSLPGTAAEILDDDVRAVLCPDKLSTAQWLAIVEAAHRRGLRTTATIMFGHIDRPEHWARHLLHIRDLQDRTGGFHRVRAAAVRAHGSAALSERTRAEGSDLARDDSDACGVTARAASGNSRYPGVMGEARRGGRSGVSQRRRQRSRRHLDERKHLAGRRHGARPGARARTDGRPDRCARPRAAPTHHALSRRADGALRGLLPGAGARAVDVRARAASARPYWRVEPCTRNPKSKIAVLGGTGKEGSAWRSAGPTPPSCLHRVAVARTRAGRRRRDQYAHRRRPDQGADNLGAAQHADIVVLTVPHAAQLSTLQEVKVALAGKILIDVTVPLVPPQVGRVQLPDGGSAAVKAQAMLGPGVRVVSAFQNVSAELLASSATPSIATCWCAADDREARAQVIAAGAARRHAGVPRRSAGELGGGGGV